MLKYSAKYWDFLDLWLTVGRIEIDNKPVQSRVRTIALNRKNAQFAGHDAGVQNWAMLACMHDCEVSWKIIKYTLICQGSLPPLQVLIGIKTLSNYCLGILTSETTSRFAWFSSSFDCAGANDANVAPVAAANDVLKLAICFVVLSNYGSDCGFFDRLLAH